MDDDTATKDLDPRTVLPGGPDITGLDRDTETELWTALDQLAAELSSATIRVDGDRIDDALHDGLARIGEVLDVDRAAVFVYSEDGKSIEHVLDWQRTSAVAAPEGLRRLSWYGDRLLAGDVIVLNCLPDDLPLDARRDWSTGDPPRVKSHLLMPARVAAQQVCALSLDSIDRFLRWTPAIIERVRFIADILAAAVHRHRQEQSLREITAEVARLGGRSGLESEYLREEVDHLHGFDEIVGDSPALRAAIARLIEVAPTDATVLLLGDTGTGKEIFARALHARSPRRHRPLVRVNCVALPPTLIESELFGHERGAFTGAVTARQGRFELADKGTLFLDEIGDFPQDLQAKLLRVLQEGEFERLGSSHTHKVDVRVIAATHRDLEAAKAEGRFRTDLFYRLNVFPIRLPALRERREDIPPLVWFIIHRRQRALGRRIAHIAPDVMEMLQRYDWPGNVRELENVIERAMIRSTGDSLLLPDGLGARVQTSAPAERGTLDRVERGHIEEVLQRCNWRINGVGNAAEQLGLHPNTLRFRMKKLNITRPAAPSKHGH